MELSEQVMNYYVRIQNFTVASNAALLHLEHIYYKHDTVAIAIQRAHLFNKTWGQHKDLHPASLGHITSSQSFDCKVVHPASFNGNPSVQQPTYQAAAKVRELSQFIFKHGDDRSRSRTLLCCVFHHAIHDEYYAARDKFLISHIQETVDKMDVKTQILYNRCLVVLGLCAFRMGLISKAHECLSGICTGRIKELLAQGQTYNRYHEKDKEQEKMERRRLLPYHMHLNPDLLECCHLITAMFLELPNICRLGGNYTVNQGYVTSRNFRKYFDSYNKQVFNGPPENTREHILAAAKALLNGKWKYASELIVNLDAWHLLPGDGMDRVKKMLLERIKEEGIRIYLLAYGAYFESISLAHLCEMFEMDKQVARKVISKMIFNKEISAAWEHPADILILYKVDPTPVQLLSQTVAEKVASLMETNERILDPFSGMYGYKDDGKFDSHKDGSRVQQGGRKQWNKGSSQSSNRNGHPRVVGTNRNQKRNVTKTNAWSGNRKPTYDNSRN